MLQVEKLIFFSGVTIRTPPVDNRTPPNIWSSCPGRLICKGYLVGKQAWLIQFHMSCMRTTFSYELG